MKDYDLKITSHYIVNTRFDMSGLFTKINKKQHSVDPNLARRITQHNFLVRRHLSE